MPEDLNFRALVCEGLLSVIEKQQSLSSIIPVLSAKIDATDKPLMQELLFGCCRWYPFLDAHNQHYLDRPLGKKDNVTRVLLVLGAYQIVFTRIPDHAAIFETVEAAKYLNQLKTKSLVNAVLRKIAASPPDTSTAEANQASYPDWIIAKLTNNWPEHAESILLHGNLRPPMTVRINSRQTTRDEYASLLSDSGIEHRPCPHATNGITLSTPVDVSVLPNFGDGMVSVQDEAAQLCCSLLDLEPSLRVLDACAAPGGKTCAMLEQQPDLSMLALDHDASRMRRVEENLERLRLNATTAVANAAQVDDWWDRNKFDRILLDAPCSATGVIRRHPDIKLLRKPEDLKNLADLQLQLLISLWQTLKTGGILLYATCSLFPQENSRVIQRFLKQEASAHLESIDVSWGLDTGFGVQLFPQAEGHDGFFYAKLKKREI